MLAGAGAATGIGEQEAGGPGFRAPLLVGKGGCREAARRGLGALTADSPAHASPDTQLCSCPAGQSLSTGRSEGPSRVRAEGPGGRRASTSRGPRVCALPTPDSTGCGACQRPEARVESPGMRCGMEPGPGRNPAASRPDAFHPRARRAQNHANWSRQAGVLTEELKRSLPCPHAHPSSSPPSSSAPGVLPRTDWLELGTYVHSPHRPPCASAIPVPTRQPSHVALRPHTSAHLPRTDKPPPAGLLPAPRPSNPTLLTPYPSIVC